MKSNLLNKQVKRYIRRVRKLLICSARSKRNFITHLKDSIDAFINESSDCTMADIIEFSGKPETLARNFMETLDKKEIKRAHRSRLLLKISLLALLLCILAFLVYLLILVCNSRGLLVIESQAFITSKYYN